MYQIVLLLIISSILAKEELFQIIYINNLQGIYFEEGEPLSIKEEEITALTEIDLDLIRFRFDDALQNQMEIIGFHCKENRECTDLLHLITFEIESLNKVMTKLEKFLPTIITKSDVSIESVKFKNNRIENFSSNLRSLTQQQAWSFNNTTVYVMKSSIEDSEKYTDLVNLWGNFVRKIIDYHIDTYKKIYTIIDFTLNHHISPLLCSSPFINNLYKDITYNKTYLQAIAFMNPYCLKTEKFLKSHVNYRHPKLEKLFTFDLYSKETLKIYKMYPLYSNLYIGNNYLVSSILPEKDYSILKNDLHSLKKCLEHGNNLESANLYPAWRTALKHNRLKAIVRLLKINNFKTRPMTAKKYS